MDQNMAIKAPYEALSDLLRKQQSQGNTLSAPQTPSEQVEMAQKALAMINEHISVLAERLAPVITQMITQSQEQYAQNTADGLRSIDSTPLGNQLGGLIASLSDTATRIDVLTRHIVL